MVPSTLIAGLLAAAAPSGEVSAPTIMTVGTRTPLALVLNTPSGRKGRLGVTEILDALAQPLQAHTDLTVVPVETSAVAGCEGALACLARRVPQGGAHLLVVSYFASSDARPDRVSALWIDVAAAEACASDLFAGGKIDDCVSERAVRARPAPRTMGDAGEAKSALRGLVQEDLRSVLEAAGHWEPTGAIEARGIPAGAAVLLDEQTIGVAPGGPVRVQGVAPGDHTLAVHREGVAVASSAALVNRSETTSVEIRIERGGFESPLFWTGLSVAAVGAGLTVWSAAYASSQGDYVRTCPAGSCGATFYTVEQMARGDIELFQTDPNKGSVLGLPLGYSLLLTGGIWAVGSQLLADDEVLHWILVGAGIAAGGLAYGISAAANGP